MIYKNIIMLQISTSDEGRSSSSQLVDDNWVFTGAMRNNYHVYGRNNHNEKEELQDKLKDIYGAKYALVTTSGMNAISTIFNTYIRNKFSVNIVCSDELYCDTIPTLNYIKVGLLSGPGLEQSTSYSINVSDSENIIRLFEDNYKNREVLVFLESCTNPSSKIFNFNIIRRLRKITKNKLVVIVDNTWLSGYAFNPFKFGVDVVVESLTKYYSAGKTICGAIITNNKHLLSDSKRFMSSYGIHVAPGVCRRISTMINYTEERIKMSSYNTSKIIEFLRTMTCWCSNATHSPCMLSLRQSMTDVHIYHPSLKSHPEYIFAKNNFKYYPSVFYFKFKKTKEEFMSWLLNTSTNIKYKTSYGSSENKIDQQPHVDEDGYMCCRMAVSYDVDSYHDAIKDLQLLF
jgi:cystathionine beta-lyase/cystathionine gamma-synthase